MFGPLISISLLAITLPFRTESITSSVSPTEFLIKMKQYIDVAIATSCCIISITNYDHYFHHSIIFHCFGGMNCSFNLNILTNISNPSEKRSYRRICLLFTKNFPFLLFILNACLLSKYIDALSLDRETAGWCVYFKKMPSFVRQVGFSH